MTEQVKEQVKHELANISDIDRKMLQYADYIEKKFSQEHMESRGYNYLDSSKSRNPLHYLFLNNNVLTKSSKCENITKLEEECETDTKQRIYSKLNYYINEVKKRRVEINKDNISKNAAKDRENTLLTHKITVEETNLDKSHGLTSDDDAVISERQNRVSARVEQKLGNRYEPIVESEDPILSNYLNNIKTILTTQIKNKFVSGKESKHIIIEDIRTLITPSFKLAEKINNYEAIELVNIDDCKEGGNLLDAIQAQYSCDDEKKNEIESKLKANISDYSFKFSTNKKDFLNFFDTDEIFNQVITDYKPLLQHSNFISSEIFYEKIIDEFITFLFVDWENVKPLSILEFEYLLQNNFTNFFNIISDLADTIISSNDSSEKKSSAKLAEGSNARLLQELTVVKSSFQNEKKTAIPLSLLNLTIENKYKSVPELLLEFKKYLPNIDDTKLISLIELLKSNLVLASDSNDDDVDVTTQEVEKYNIQQDLIAMFLEKQSFNANISSNLSLGKYDFHVSELTSKFKIKEDLLHVAIVKNMSELTDMISSIKISDLILHNIDIDSYDLLSHGNLVFALLEFILLDAIKHDEKDVSILKLIEEAKLKEIIEVIIERRFPADTAKILSANIYKIFVHIQKRIMINSYGTINKPTEGERAGDATLFRVLYDKTQDSVKDKILIDARNTGIKINLLKTMLNMYDSQTFTFKNQLPFILYLFIILLLIMLYLILKAFGK